MANRSYSQYCGLARSLDVVGDRWALLVVRQLLAGPARYRDLAAGLPGIATNLLADRLKALTDDGVVQRRLDPERNGAVYELTAWGQQLREPIEGLIRWSVPLMATGPAGDIFRPEWLGIALRALLRDRRANPTVEVGFETAGTMTTVRVGRRGARVEVGTQARPRTVLRAEPGIVLGLVSGVLTARDAAKMGELSGRAADLAAVAGT